MLSNFNAHQPQNQPLQQDNSGTPEETERTDPRAPAPSRLLPLLPRSASDDCTLAKDADPNDVCAADENELLCNDGLTAERNEALPTDLNDVLATLAQSSPCTFSNLTWVDSWPRLAGVALCGPCGRSWRLLGRPRAPGMGRGALAAGLVRPAQASLLCDTELPIARGLPFAWHTLQITSDLSTG